MKKGKKKRKPFYEILGDFILDVETFDLEKDNENDYNRIHELIAYELLVSWGWSVRQIQYQFSAYVKKVRNTLYGSIKYIEEGTDNCKGKNVYCWTGGKINNIKYSRVITGITVNKKYKNVEDKDFRRIIKRFESAGNSLVDDINNKYPDKRKEIGLPVGKMIKKLEEPKKEIEYKKIK